MESMDEIGKIQEESLPYEHGWLRLVDVSIFPPNDLGGDIVTEMGFEPRRAESANLHAREHDERGDLALHAQIYTSLSTLEPTHVTERMSSPRCWERRWSTNWSRSAVCP